MVKHHNAWGRLTMNKKQFRSCLTEKKLKKNFRFCLTAAKIRIKRTSAHTECRYSGFSTPCLKDRQSNTNTKTKTCSENSPRPSGKTLLLADDKNKAVTPPTPKSSDREISGGGVSPGLAIAPTEFFKLMSYMSMATGI